MLNGYFTTSSYQFNGKYKTINNKKKLIHGLKYNTKYYYLGSFDDNNKKTGAGILYNPLNSIMYFSNFFNDNHVDIIYMLKFKSGYSNLIIKLLKTSKLDNLFETFDNILSNKVTTYLKYIQLYDSNTKTGIRQYYKNTYGIIFDGAFIYEKDVKDVNGSGNIVFCINNYNMPTIIDVINNNVSIESVQNNNMYNKNLIYKGKWTNDEFSVNEKTGPIQYGEFKDYIMIKYINRGSFGLVYECINLKSKKNYCVKISYYNKKDKDNDDRELLILRDLKCNEIIDNNYITTLCLKDYYVMNSKLYLFTNYIEDTNNLNEYLYLNKINIKIKFKILFNISQGIKVLHDKSIIHLDLKPENILINYNNLKITIIDLGFSCFSNECDMNYRGTVSYISPEMHFIGEEKTQDNIKLSVKTDIFSLFYIFYEILMRGENYEKRISTKYYDDYELQKYIDELINNINDKYNKYNYYNELYLLLVKMSEINLNKRCTITYVINKLQNIINLI